MENTKSITLTKALEWKDSLSPIEQNQLFADNKISLNLLEDEFMWRILYLGKCTLTSFVQKCHDIFLDFKETRLSSYVVSNQKSINTKLFLHHTQSGVLFVVSKKVGMNTIKVFLPNSNKEIMYEIKNTQAFISLITAHDTNFILDNCIKNGDLTKLN